MSGKIRVLIVDDIAESRDNVAKLLRFEPDVDVVGMADNGEQALSLCERLEPSIVLMDVNMPGMDGITATNGTGTTTYSIPTTFDGNDGTISQTSGGTFVATSLFDLNGGQLTLSGAGNFIDFDDLRRFFARDA